MKFIFSQFRVLIFYTYAYFLHFPCAAKRDKKGSIDPRKSSGDPDLDTSWDFIDSYRELEELYFKGKVKAIGLANISLIQLRRVIKICHIKPQVIQIECHPYERGFLKFLIFNVCQKVKTVYHNTLGFYKTDVSIYK